MSAARIATCFGRLSTGKSLEFADVHEKLGVGKGFRLLDIYQPVDILIKKCVPCPQALRSAEAMKQIKDLVSIIQQATIDSADVTRAGRDKVHAGGRTVEEALIALKTISAFAESTLVSAKDITQSTSAQSYSSEQLARSVTEISAVAKQIEQGSKEINSAITGLRQFAESLRSTVAEKARAHYRCSICGKEFCIKHSQIQRNLTVICQDCSVKTKEGFKP